MKPDEAEELQAAIAAYVPNVPNAPIEEPVKENSAQPHLLTEAIMVDLLAKSVVENTYTVIGHLSSSLTHSL